MTDKSLRILLPQNQPLTFFQGCESGQGFIFQKSPTGRKLSVKTILPVDLILSNDSNRSGSSSRKIRKGDLGQSFALASGCCLETYFSSPAHNLYMPG